MSKTTLAVRERKRRSKSLQPAPLGRQEWAAYSLAERGVMRMKDWIWKFGSFCKEKFGHLKEWLFEEEEFETLILDEDVDKR